MKNTLISIIIANLNGENFLEPCLVSVLKEKYQNYEIIILDDGSTDGSLKLL
jgi:glycosyltransferase involved in cell wall biosynthesis